MKAEIDNGSLKRHEKLVGQLTEVVMESNTVGHLHDSIARAVESLTAWGERTRKLA